MCNSSKTLAVVAVFLMESLVSASSRTQILSSPADIFLNRATESRQASLGFNYRPKPKQNTFLCKMSASKEGKLWGGRFEESVTEAVEKFTESISYDKALYKHDIMGSKAHASMLAQQVGNSLDFHFCSFVKFLGFGYCC